MVTEPDADSLLRMLQESQAIQFGTFTLASGKTSSYYIDMKKVTQPRVLQEIARRMLPHTEGHQWVAGVELGAIPLTVALSLASGLPYLMVRRERKDHGTGKVFEGELTPGDRVLFVEDTTTTAMTLLRGIQTIREAGGVVEKAVVVVDRGEGALENLAAAGVALTSLVPASDLSSGPSRQR